MDANSNYRQEPPRVRFNLNVPGQGHEDQDIRQAQEEPNQVENERAESYRVLDEFMNKLIARSGYAFRPPGGIRVPNLVRNNAVLDLIDGIPAPEAPSSDEDEDYENDNDENSENDENDNSEIDVDEYTDSEIEDEPALVPENRNAIALPLMVRLFKHAKKSFIKLGTVCLMTAGFIWCMMILQAIFIGPEPLNYFLRKIPVKFPEFSLEGWKFYSDCVENLQNGLRVVSPKFPLVQAPAEAESFFWKFWKMITLQY